MLAALLSLALTAAPRPLVYVPEAATAESCFVLEALAAELELSTAPLLVRGPRPEGDLEEARKRAGAAVALDGRRSAEGKVELELARAGQPITRAAEEGQDALGRALERLWPRDQGGPGGADLGAANEEALLAACAGDAALAYAASGAAVGPVVRRRVAPLPGPFAGVFQRFARAAGLARSGRCREALPLYRTVVSELAGHGFGPVWRRAIPDERPTTVDLFGATAVVFSQGTFVALEVASGRERWRRPTGPAHPHLVPIGAEVALALTGREVQAIDLASGKLTWRAPLKRPFPEVVVRGQEVYVAGEERLLALDVARGAERWSFDPLVDMQAGPSFTQGALALAAESAVLLLDPATGKELARVEVGDEISAPLLAGPEALWGLVGGDEVVAIDSKSRTVRARAKDLPGVDWPPALIADELVVALRRGPKRLLAYLDPAAKALPSRLYPGADPPLAALPSFAGVVHGQERPPALFARDRQGAVLWRLGLPRRAVELRATDEALLVAAGTRALVLEPKKGGALAELELGEPTPPEPGRRAPAQMASVLALDYSPLGGVALLSNGSVLGLPSPADPRLARELRAARLELGECALAAAQPALAAAAAQQLLDRAPDDLAAALLSARAQEKLGRQREAAEAHLAVLRSAGGAALGPAAASATTLAELTGVRGPLALPLPALGVHAAQPDRLVVRTAEGVLAIDPATPAAPAWTRPGGRLGPGGPGMVRVDEELVRAADGQRLRSAPPGQWISGGQLLRWNGAVSLEDPTGAVRWTTTLPARATALAAAGERHALFLSEETGRAFVLSLAEGGPRLELVPEASPQVEGRPPPLAYSSLRGAQSEPLEGALITGGRALLLSASRLYGLDLEAGRLLFTLARGPGGGPRISTRAGYLVANGARLVHLDAEKGRLLGQLVLPAPPVELLAVPASPERDLIYARLESGELVALDLAPLSVRGRLSFGRIIELSAAEGTLFVLDGGGLVWSVEGARGLRR